jgi:major membrane immunogen (membrane-anchored lipoprotein)
MDLVEKYLGESKTSKEISQLRGLLKSSFGVKDGEFIAKPADYETTKKAMSKLTKNKSTSDYMDAMVKLGLIMVKNNKIIAVN